MAQLTVYLQTPAIDRRQIGVTTLPKFRVLDRPCLIPQTGLEGREASPISLRVFSNTTDRQEIYRLRYRAYLESKLIEPSPGESFSDTYDALQTSKTLGAFYNGVCVGSVRLAFGTGGSRTATMPCQSIFGDVAQVASAKSGTLVEFTRMVVDPAITNNSMRSTLYGAIVRGGMVVCNAGQADFALIAVMPKMTAFYRMMCGFNVLAEPRPYPGISEETNLMGRSFKALDDRRSGRNRFFNITPLEVDAVRPLFDVQPSTDAA